MKKLIVAVFSFALFFSCKQETPVDYVLLTGNIKNSDAEVVKISGNGFSQEVTIKDGIVSDTLRIADNGFYNLRVGRESTPMYLNKGDQINFSIDAAQFDETISYEGVGADVNNYLAKKFLLKETTLGQNPEFYSLEEHDFIARSQEYLSKVKDSWKNVALTDEFKRIEEKNLEYDHALHISNYETYHRHYAKKDTSFHVSDTFLDKIKDLDLSNETDYKNSSSYQRLVSSSFFKTLSDKYESTNDYSLAFMEAAKELPNQYIKNDILRENASFAISPNEHLKKSYDFFMANSTNEDDKASFTELYEGLKVLAQGNPSPAFNYENHKGGTTSLADLKGKYVYVDVWATWCGPCKAEIPYLKQVEKEYHDKNVEFVSISIDVKKDYEKWKAMVSEKELGGIQLFADNDWKSDFVTAYKINGIPRFILIDPDGNIVSADAPRPSNPILKEKLNTLL